MPSATGGTVVSPLTRILRNPWIGFLLAIIVVGLDQYTKMLASTQLTYRVPVEITAWFDLMLAHNTGAAFSFLASAGGWQRWFLAAVAGVVSVVVAVWLTRLEAEAAYSGTIARTHFGWWFGQPNRSSDTRLCR